MEEVRLGRLVFLPGPNRGQYPHCHSLFIDDEVKAILDPASDQVSGFWFLVQELGTRNLSGCRTRT